MPRGVRVCACVAVTAIVVGCVPALAHASFPGTNGKISFSLGTSISTIDPDGTGEQVFLADPPRRFEGAWSPDGTKMVYRRGIPAGDPGLAVVNADGTNDHFIQNDPGLERDPAWSPDGTKVVYWRLAQPYNNGAIFVANVDGSGSTQLTTTDATYSYAPEWSPDGARIAFVRLGNETEIWTMNADGTDQVNITETPGVGEYNPSWSPDGSRIAYLRFPRSEVAVMDRDGDNQTAVASASPPGSPVWSPDGTKLAYSTDGTIWTIGLGGGGPVPIRSGTVPPQVENLDWQPIPVTAYPRPRGATPVQVSLVPAYGECSAPTREHGPPLAFGSCNPPTQSSTSLTVGTADSNLRPTRSTSYAGYNVIVGNPATPADEADVQITLFVNDVYTQGGLTDYAGELRASAALRITDKLNTPSPGGPQAGTMQDIVLSPIVPCAATMDPNEGATCSLTTSGDALAPGTVPEARRSVWQLGHVQVEDGGPDGDADTGEDNTPFMRQGVFVP